MPDEFDKFMRYYTDIVLGIIAAFPHAVTEARRVEDPKFPYNLVLVIDPAEYLEDPDDILEAMEGAVIAMYDDDVSEGSFYDSEADAWGAFLPEDRPRVEVGQRVRFRRPFDAMGDAIPAGTTGTVVDGDDDDSIGVRLDEPVEGLEYWDNAVLIYQPHSCDPRSAAEYAATLLSVDA